jgi:methyltransferase (TIGR00027 family)
MQTGQPSRTALGAAGLRAAHQVLEGGAIFADPLALRILGISPDDVDRNAEADVAHLRLRYFTALRPRTAEDALIEAVARGASQLVVLGAGLDTFAYRTTLGDRLRIFEVDHPDTQAWKRQRLADAAIPIPPTLTFVPVNFETETLLDKLAAAGFDTARRSFFTWLGVVPYLTETAIFATLAAIASLPRGAEVVFDYVNPSASIEQQGTRTAHEALATRVATLGETLQNAFDTDALRTSLIALGFRDIDDAGPQQLAARFFPDRATEPPRRGAHVVRAATASQGG